MTISSNESQPSRTSDSRIPAPSPMESVPATRMRCPNCDLPAIAPVVSTYLRDCIVENDWLCSACGFEWSSSFNGLVV
jgi:rubredoxin